MAYLLDGLTILILVFSVWRGGRRGMVHTVLMLVGCVVAAVLAGRFSAPVAARAYDAFVEPRVEQSLVAHVQEEELRQMEIPLSSLLGDAAEPLSPYLLELGVPESVTVGFDDLSEEGIRASLSPAMREMVRPTAVSLLTAAARLLLFLLLLLVVILLVWLVDRVFRLPGLKQVNRVGGWVVGALQGVFWVIVFAVAVRLGAACGLFGSLITVETVERTWLLSRVSISLVLF